MLILMALGVSRETALEDYEMSNQCFREQIRLNPLAGVKRSTAESVLDLITERYGSMDKYYIAEFGLDVQRSAKLRDRFLEPDRR